MSEFSYIETNISEIKEEIRAYLGKCNRAADGVTLIAVSKTFPPEAVCAAFSAGQLDFGENKVRELCVKHEALKHDALKRDALTSAAFDKLQWHLIGHLQTNKVKFIVPFVYMVHTLDSVHLAAKIQSEAAKAGRTINCLIQVNTSGEDQKSGIAPGEAIKLVRDVSQMKNLKILGLMTIAKFIDDYKDNIQRDIVRANFKQLKSLYDEIGSLMIPGVEMKYLSMGMTSDYDLALEEGSNMLRIGTAIFGKRQRRAEKE